MLRASSICLAALALLATGLLSSAAHATSPRLRQVPYRRGLAAEVGLGPHLCIPGGAGGGTCDPGISGAVGPSVGLTINGGVRITPVWMVGVGWTRAGLSPGADLEGGDAFSAVTLQGYYAVVRPTLPLLRHDLGLELGFGWSKQSLEGPADLAAGVIESSGFSMRPALVWDWWVIADMFIGLRAEAMVNLHTRFCVDEVCGSTLDAVPGPYQDVFVNGATLGVRIGGLFNVFL